MSFISEFFNADRRKPDDKPDNKPDPHPHPHPGPPPPDPGDHTPMQIIYAPTDTWHVKRFGNKFIITLEPDGEYGQEYMVAVQAHHPPEVRGFLNLDEALRYCWHY